MRRGEVAPLPGLEGVRVLRRCACCRRLREGEAWRLERLERVIWRRSRVGGAVAVCGACLVSAVVQLLRRGARLEAGPGGAWLRLEGRRASAVGPLALRRALELGRAEGRAECGASDSAPPGRTGAESGRRLLYCDGGGGREGSALTSEVSEFPVGVKGGGGGHG